MCNMSHMSLTLSLCEICERDKSDAKNQNLKLEFNLVNML